MLDEFANIGKLAGLAESLTALPGLGVRVWMIVQELAELVRIYGPNTAKTIQSQAEVRQFFAVNAVLIFPKSAEVKFPTTAVAVISRLQ
jgi:type IV secretion system protein VirD4